MKPQWATIGRWGLFFLLLAAPSIVELSAKAEETSSPARDIDPEALVRKLTVAVERDAPDTVLRLLDGVDAEEICFSPLHEAALEAGDRFRDCLMCPKMVVVPAGSFLMGSPQDEEGREEVEGPQHAVTIPRPFAVGVYEVTLREWCAYRDGRVCSSVPRAYCPCAAYDERTCRDPKQTSWVEAQSYVEWLSQATGRRYRLLSEAEWEYVARAGTATPFHTGSTISTAQAHHYGNYAPGHPGVYGYEARHRGEFGTTEYVGSFASNAFGLYDVHGNVWEWVRDCWNDSYVGAPADGSAWTEGNCARRVLRDGDYYSEPQALRSAHRSWGNLTSNFRSSRVRYTTGFRGSVGFRVARTLAADADMGLVDDIGTQSTGANAECRSATSMETE